MKKLTSDSIQHLGEFEEANGNFREFELRDEGILVTLEDTWSVLIPNSHRIVQLLRILNKGDRVAILCGDDSNHIQIRKI